MAKQKNGEEKPRPQKTQIFADEEAKAWWIDRDSLGSGLAPSRYIPIFGGEPGKGPLWGLGHIVKRLGRPLTLEDLKFLVVKDGTQVDCSYRKEKFQPVKFAIITRKWLEQLEDRKPEVLSDIRPRFAGCFFSLGSGRRFAFSGGNCVFIRKKKRLEVLWDERSALFLSGRYVAINLERRREESGDPKRYVPFVLTGETSNPGRLGRGFQVSGDASSALEDFMVRMGLADKEQAQELVLSAKKDAAKKGRGKKKETA